MSLHDAVLVSVQIDWAVGQWASAFEKPASIRRVQSIVDAENRGKRSADPVPDAKWSDEAGCRIDAELVQQQLASDADSTPHTYSPATASSGIPSRVSSSSSR